MYEPRLASREAASTSAPRADTEALRIGPGRPATPGDQPKLVGSSPALRHALRDLPAIAEGAAPVLLLGESGTGKELVARLIHRRSRCSRGAFVALNCAAIPAELFESELFGHVAGSFSGALRDKRGLMETAHRGTLFLDEIGELPPSFQAKLLRVLEDGELRRVGETTGRRIDFRLVSATNRDLERDVLDGRFRQDLYYRVNVFSVTLPPLRERRSDIPELAAHLLGLAARRQGRVPATISAPALERLRAHDWSGNVRELANVLERAVAVSRSSVIEAGDLGLGVAGDGAEASAGLLRAALSGLERKLVADALRRCGGNVSAAARELGVVRQQLQRLIRRHSLGRVGEA